MAEGRPLLPHRREAHLSTGRQRALWGAVIGLGCVALLAAVVEVGREDVSRAAVVQPVVLAEELPESVTDIINHVDVEGKKSFLNDVFASSQGGQVLHPLGNLDPFTNEPIAEDDYETLLRAKATKAISDNALEFATSEMVTAQGAAREVTGADAGCTHLNVNQTDYAGEQAAAVTGALCMPWADAAAKGITSAYVTDLATYSSLTVNYCRNPDAAKIGSWCYLADATAGQIAADAEGGAWEYCDVGRRCAQDMPVLKPAAGAQAPVLTAKAVPVLKTAQGAVLGAKSMPVLAAKQTPVLAARKHPVLSHKEKHPVLSHKQTHPVLSHKQTRPVLRMVGEEGQALSAMSKSVPQGVSGRAGLSKERARRSRGKVGMEGHAGLSGPAAARAVGRKDWFELDRSAVRRVDRGEDAPLSGEGARRDVESQFPASRADSVE